MVAITTATGGIATIAGGVIAAIAHMDTTASSHEFTSAADTGSAITIITTIDFALFPAAAWQPPPGLHIEGTKLVVAHNGIAANVGAACKVVERKRSAGS